MLLNQTCDDCSECNIYLCKFRTAAHDRQRFNLPHTPPATSCSRQMLLQKRAIATLLLPLTPTLTAAILARPRTETHVRHLPTGAVGQFAYERASEKRYVVML